MTTPLYVIDSSGMLFRAFYAVAPLTTRSGFPTNALFGYSRMLLKLLKEVGAHEIIGVFDAGRETFRNKLYPEYKANRTELPQELALQMPYFREITRALGVPVLELKGYEADDLIATVVKKLQDSGREIVIISADKDLMQLVDERVHLWDTLKDKHYRAPEVSEKWGVSPAQVAEVLALMGDSSDNIPGLSGCGPKTAAQLVQRFGGVENILANIDSVGEDASLRNRKKIAEQLKIEAETVRLSRRLVELESAVPFLWEGRDIRELSAEDLITSVFHRQQVDAPRLKELSERFEFSDLFSPLIAGVRSESEPLLQVQYQTVLAPQFPEFIKRLGEQREFAFDCETTSLDVKEAALVGASFCWSDTEAWYVPLAHQGAEAQVPLADFLAAIRPIFSDGSIRKAGQNLKYDVGVFAEHGVPLAGISFDSMLAAYLLDPDKGSYNLTVLADTYLGRPTIEFDQVTSGSMDFRATPIDRACEYACQDAHFVWLLLPILRSKLSEAELDGVFHEIEMPLVPVLSSMERLGISLDVGFLRSMSQEFEERLASLQKQLYELAKGEFNLNSPKQLADVLFGRLGLSSKGLRRTKTGISTDAAALEKLSGLHPLPKLLLEHRSLFKLKSTYIDALPLQVSAKTGRIHTSFNQTGTATGRLSSSDPNLQNIPISTEEGRRIRRAFVAAPGYTLISADYSQIELRVLAHMSEDQALISAFQRDADIHTETAKEIMGLLIVSPEQRRIGKTINFGVVYGMGPFRLSKELNIPLREASEYIDGYFRRFAGVKRFFDGIEMQAKKQGWVSTLFGRRRIVKGLDQVGRDEGFLVRAAMNAPIQGTAADLMKKAMLNMQALCERELSGVRMLLQIHDELVFECPEDRLSDVMPEIRRAMESVIKLSVPLKVEIGTGRSWEEAH